MRRMLMVAAAAAVMSLFGTAGAGAANLSGPGIRAAADALGLAQPVRSVCREVCRDGYCRQRCWEEPANRERRVHREAEDDPQAPVFREAEDDPQPPIYYGRPRESGPGIGIYGPGFGIGVGR